MAVADDEQVAKNVGFSGLSTLVSDVEVSRTANSATVDSTATPSVPPPSNPRSTIPDDAPTAPRTPRSTQGKSENSSDVTTGKWMVGIGLAIGLLLIIFVKAAKQEAPRPQPFAVTQPPSKNAPTYQPPPPAPSLPKQQPSQTMGIQKNTGAESVDVLGQRVVFSNPSGYCTPGKSERELELMDLARRSLGEGARLVHAAVQCSELDDYRMGRRDLLDHWLQIQLLGPKGNFQRLEVPREAFLDSVSKSSPRIDPAEINQRLKSSLNSSDISLSQTNIEPIGRDGNAVYFSMRMRMNFGESGRPITGISGITLLNSLPLSINVYEGTGSSQSRSQLQAVHQELLSSLLTEN